MEKPLSGTFPSEFNLEEINVNNEIKAAKRPNKLIFSTIFQKFDPD